MTEAFVRTEPRSRPSAAGGVVLEIGESFGALVVRAEGSAEGSEIEIRRTGESWRGKHTAVRERHTPERTFRAGLFQSLAAGTYEIRWRRSDGDSSVSPTRAVRVFPGLVTETAL